MMKEEDQIQFLNAIVQKTHTLADHVDIQASILLGVTSTVFVFSGSRVLDGQGGLPFFILSLSAACSAFLSLFAIHPPRGMRKRGQNESLLYNKQIASFASNTEYREALEDMFRKEDGTIDHYAREIYNVSKFYYRPKRVLFNTARTILVIGIGSSLLAFVFAL